MERLQVRSVERWEFRVNGGQHVGTLAQYRLPKSLLEEFEFLPRLLWLVLAVCPLQQERELARFGRSQRPLFLDLVQLAQWSQRLVASFAGMSHLLPSKRALDSKGQGLHCFRLVVLNRGRERQGFYYLIMKMYSQKNLHIHHTAPRLCIDYGGVKPMNGKEQVYSR